MGYKEPEYYLEKALKSNKAFEKRCLRCGRIFNIRDYHPTYFHKRKFCSSNCRQGYEYTKTHQEKDLLPKK